MSADQTPAADPTPGSSRVDVAGLRAAAEAATPGPWEADSHGHAEQGCRCLSCYKDASVWLTTNTIFCDEQATGEHDCRVQGYSWEDATFIAAADPTTVLALLDERDDLAARLATAEAEVEALRDQAERLGERVAYYRDSEVPALRSNADGWATRAEVAERQVQAERARVAQARTWIANTVHAAEVGVDTKANMLAALAPLDPDAPTGHDGHGDPDAHQVDTEAGDRR